MIFLTKLALLLILILPTWALAQESWPVPQILPRSTWETPTLAKLATWNPKRGGVSESAATGSDTNVEASGVALVGLPQKIFNYAPIERLIIHDTGYAVGRPGCNNEAVDDITLIQNIFKFHAVTRGWGDIGYHYVIGYDGQIYEGRRGGNGVRGAHLYDDRSCQNFNLGTVGIAVLGNYQKEPMPEIMFESLARLVAWLGYANDLDVTATQVTTPVWSNTRIVGSDGKAACDVSSGGYSLSFTGPTVLTHHDIEAGNSDIESLDLKRLRQRAAELSAGYKSLAFESSDQSGIYVINQRRLRKIGERNVPLTSGRWQSVVPMSAWQLASFPLANGVAIANGTLVSIEGAPDWPIYFVENEERRPIYVPELIAEYYLTDAPRATYKRLELNDYPEGPPLIFIGPVILKNTADDTLYLIENGVRRALGSNDDLPDLSIVGAPPELVAAHASAGLPEILPDQTLVRGLDSPEIYLILKGQRWRFSDINLFEARGYKWADIMLLTQAEVSGYPLAGYVKWPDGAVLKGDARPEVYLVAQGKLRWIKTAQVLRAMGLKTTDVRTVSQAEIQGYQVSEPITKVTTDVRVLLRHRSTVAFLPWANLAELFNNIGHELLSIMAQAGAIFENFFYGRQ